MQDTSAPDIYLTKSVQEMPVGSFREGCLRDNVALITGGGSGICKEVALRFMQAGCNVAILSRSMKKLEDAAAVRTSSLQHFLAVYM